MRTNYILSLFLLVFFLLALAPTAYGETSPEASGSGLRTIVSASLIIKPYKPIQKPLFGEIHIGEIHQVLEVYTMEATSLPFYKIKSDNDEYTWFPSNHVGEIYEVLGIYTEEATSQVFYKIKLDNIVS